MLEKPEDREVICHATAWDFYDGKVLPRVQLKVFNILEYFLLRRLLDISGQQIYQLVLCVLKLILQGQSTNITKNCQFFLDLFVSVSIAIYRVSYFPSLVVSLTNRTGSNKKTRVDLRWILLQNF